MKTLTFLYAADRKSLVSALALLLSASAYAQGTFDRVVTFDANPPPPGQEIACTSYTENGVTFTGDFLLTGSGVSGRPQDGTAYMTVTQGSFSMTLANPASSGRFNMVSVNVGTSISGGGVIRGHNSATGLDALATFSLGPGPFGTYTFNPSFFDIDSLTFSGTTGTFSFDNFILQPVPEPGSASLYVLGASLLSGWRFWQRRRQVVAHP